MKYKATQLRRIDPQNHRYIIQTPALRSPTNQTARPIQKVTASAEHARTPSEAAQYLTAPENGRTLLRHEATTLALATVEE